MDEDISIINTNSRIEKIKSFLIQNKKKLISTLLILIIILISVYSYEKYKNNKKKEISNQFNLTILEYSDDNRISTAQKLIDVVNFQDSTYSPLALYFIIDNKLVTDTEKVNTLFDILIQKSSLDTEIRNLVIYKKGSYNADRVNETDLLNILNPLLNYPSIWKSHALYLMGEYFYSKNEEIKSKEFFKQIISLENANTEIKLQAEKRLIRDLSE